MLMSRRGYNWNNQCIVIKPVGLYQGGLVSGGAYNRDFMVYQSVTGLARSHERKYSRGI